MSSSPFLPKKAVAQNQLRSRPKLPDRRGPPAPGPAPPAAAGALRRPAGGHRRPGPAVARRARQRAPRRRGRRAERARGWPRRSARGPQEPCRSGCRVPADARHHPDGVVATNSRGWGNTPIIAPLTHKRHIPPHPAQPQHTDHWAPRTRKRHQQEHRPQRPTERSDPTQHAKGRAGDCPGPRKGTTTRRNVRRGGGSEAKACLCTANQSPIVGPFDKIFRPEDSFVEGGGPLGVGQGTQCLRPPPPPRS